MAASSSPSPLSSQDFLTQILEGIEKQRSRMNPEDPSFTPSPDFLTNINEIWGSICSNPLPFDPVDIGRHLYVKSLENHDDCDFTLFLYKEELMNSDTGPLFRDALVYYRQWLGEKYMREYDGQLNGRHIIASCKHCRYYGNIDDEEIDDNIRVGSSRCNHGCKIVWVVETEAEISLDSDEISVMTIKYDDFLHSGDTYIGLA